MKKIILLSLAFAGFFLCTNIGQAQTLQDYLGNWKGVNVSGDSIEVSFNPNLSCVFKINGVTVFVNNAIVNYRFPNLVASSDAEVESSGGDLVRFYTQNAMQGILYYPPPGPGGQVSAPIPQVYSGLTLLSGNTLSLFIDIQNFSMTPPVVVLKNYDEQEMEFTKPYCILIKQ